MDSIYTDNLMELGTSLANLAINGTTSAINTKIKSIRDEKTQRGFVPPMMKL